MKNCKIKTYQQFPQKSFKKEDKHAVVSIFEEDNFSKNDTTAIRGESKTAHSKQ